MMTAFVGSHLFEFIIGLGVLCPLLWIIVGVGCYLYVQRIREQDRQLLAIRQYFPKGFRTEAHKNYSGELYVIVKGV